MRDKSRVYLSAPHMSGEELNYIKEAFRSNWIAPIGPHVDGFEKELAVHVGVKGAVAVNSGTAAIHLALQLLNVQQGDTVFCSSLTFIASANPIIYSSAEPVFIDSEPDTWNMSPEALLRAFEDASRSGRLPKAVIIVHLYGQSAKMTELMDICSHYQVPIIEDAAESLGSTYKGKFSGALGYFGIYSFNGNKIITTSGGGMLVSNDTEALERAKFLATQARDPVSYYEHSSLGYNYRMSNVLAGLGRGQLKVLMDRVERRRTIFEQYVSTLSDLPGIEFMPELNNSTSNRWLTTLTIREDEAGLTIDELLRALEHENIEARRVWKPMHIQPVFSGTCFYAHDVGVHVSEQLFESGLCLPSGSIMTEDDQWRVIGCIQQVFKRCAKRSFSVG